MPRRGFDAAASLSILGALVCWSVVPLMLKALTQAVPDGWTTNAVRYPVSAMLYLPWLIAAARDPSARRLWRAAVIPSIPNVLGQSCWAWGPYFIDPGIMSFIVRLSVVWAMIMAMIVFRDERPLLRSPRFWAGMVLSLAGFVTITTGKEHLFERQTLMGVGIALVCSFFWGMYGVSVRATIGRSSPLQMFAIVSTYTSIGCLALAPLGDPASVLRLSAFNLSLLVVSALVGIAAAHGLYYTALQRLGATIPATVNVLTPFMTATASTFLFHERITAVQWVGGAVSVVGSILVVLSQGHLHAAADGRAPGMGAVDDGTAAPKPMPHQSLS